MQIEDAYTFVLTRACGPCYSIAGRFIALKRNALKRMSKTDGKFRCCDAG